MQKFIIAFLSLFAIFAYAEVPPNTRSKGEPLQVQSAEKNGVMCALADVTGFHTFFFKKDGLEFKLFEEDTSITVCSNPVRLYAIITNNGIEADSIIEEWNLPIHVSEVKKVVQIERGLRIQAICDSMTDSGAIKPTKHCIIELTYTFEKGVLDKKLKVVKYDTK